MGTVWRYMSADVKWSLIRGSTCRLGSPLIGFLHSLFFFFFFKPYSWIKLSKIVFYPHKLLVLQFPIRPFHYKALLWGTCVILTYIFAIILTAWGHHGLPLQWSDFSSNTLEPCWRGGIVYCPSSKMSERSQSSLLWFHQSSFPFPPQCSATEGVQVHSDLLPCAHHPNCRVQTSYR